MIQSPSHHGQLFRFCPSPAQGRDREALLCLEAEAAAIAKQVRISLDFPVFLSFFEKHKQDTMEPAKDDFSPKCTNAGHR